MVVTGVDVGSRTIKVILMDSRGDRVIECKKVETTFNPMKQCKRLLEGLQWDRLIATGYGRRLVQESFQAEVITEIQAHALGARRLFSDCVSILDIGGQDTKAISLDDRGRIRKFEMNDRCAAGTGKFLEFMSVSFQVPIEEFGNFAMEGKPGLSINSMCTVFAETEATSLMARGNDPRDIARGAAPVRSEALPIHAEQSRYKRSSGFFRRSGQEPMCGGACQRRDRIEAPASGRAGHGWSVGSGIVWGAELR